MNALPSEALAQTGLSPIVLAAVLVIIGVAVLVVLWLRGKGRL